MNFIGELDEPFDAVVAMFDRQNEFLRGRAIQAVAQDGTDGRIPGHVRTREIGEEIEPADLIFESRLGLDDRFRLVDIEKSAVDGMARASNNGVVTSRSRIWTRSSTGSASDPRRHNTTQLRCSVRSPPPPSTKPIVGRADSGSRQFANTAGANKDVIRSSSMIDGSSDLACGGCESCTEPIEKTKVLPFIVTLASMAYAMVRRSSTYTERVSDSLSIVNIDDGPLFIMWDGIVSCFRIYNKEELLSMAKAADPADSYDWEVQEIPIPPQPIPGIALVGIPR